MLSVPGGIEIGIKIGQCIQGNEIFTYFNEAFPESIQSLDQFFFFFFLRWYKSGRSDIALFCFASEGPRQAS